MRNIRLLEKNNYHIYNRGVDKRTIFVTKEDYDRFEAYLYILNNLENTRPANYFDKRHSQSKRTPFDDPRSRQLISIGAYCLMPTHFQILATPITENGLSKFMQKITTAYTMYFNDKYQRSGSLFEGTFKAHHALDDKYLKFLLAYIHLNPAKLFNAAWREVNASELATLAASVMDYRYSSIGEYITNKHVITSPKDFPAFFVKADDVEVFVRYWLTYKDQFSGLRSLDL